MGKTSIRPFQIDGILSLLLFGTFAASLLLVLLSGARAYGQMAARDDDAYTRRTTAQYIEMKLRRAPNADAVTVGTVGDSSALLISETFDGADYVTAIYCYDGWLREYFTDAQTAKDGLEPEAGEKLLEADMLTIRQQENLLTFTFSAKQQETTLTLSLGR